MKNCRNCQNTFEITDGDRKFYQKINVPEPSFCPACREQRRMAFRNEMSLYKRKCDLCERDIVATFDKDSAYKVYCNECWWSDKWDPRDYAMDFDFSRPFFEQFKELLLKVPKSGVLQVNNENCEYNSLCAFSKNIYMSPGSYLMQDSYYTRKSQDGRDCVNSNLLNKCELVANSTNCDNCYSCHDLINCRNCSFSSYLNDCASLQNCFICSGLRNQQYCFKNQQYSKEDYERIIVEYKNKSGEELEREFQDFLKTVPQRSEIQLNCEDCTGDYLYNCKNAIECRDCFDIEDSKYIFESADVKDSMDLTIHDKEIELCYEICSGGEKNYNSKFGYCTVACPNCEYIYSCFYLSDSFGCDGFHSRSKNCILNKEYSEEGYKELKAKIIEHMKSTGEYGEFFPVSLSSYAYNETIAQDHYPLSKEEALTKGYRWKEKDPVDYRPIEGLNSCKKCSKNFRILKPEGELYKKIGIEEPKLCSDCRYRDLIGKKKKKVLK